MKEILFLVGVFILLLIGLGTLMYFHEQDIVKQCKEKYGQSFTGKSVRGFDYCIAPNGELKGI